MGILDKMEFYALDSDFNVHSVIDGYNSIIWTERYDRPGDFEIFGANNDQLRKIINEASYIFNTANSKLMVIEEVEVEYDEEEGSDITISGRSIVSVLDRRIILTQATILNPTDRRISQIICDMVESAFDNSDAARYWAMLEVTNDTASTSEKLDVDVGMEFTLGENILEVAVELAQAFDLGLKCVYDKVNKKVEFSVYEGADKSQQGEDLVMFSDLYDNLATAKERLLHYDKKTALLTIGSAEDPTTGLPKLPQLITTGATGINRREGFFEAKQDDVIYSDPTDIPMTNAQYSAALVRAGTSELSRSIYKVIRDYDGSVIETEHCTYGEDFELGDLVQFWMPHSNPATVRLVAVTFSIDGATGASFVPRFDYV